MPSFFLDHAKQAPLTGPWYFVFTVSEMSSPQIHTCIFPSFLSISAQRTSSFSQRLSLTILQFSAIQIIDLLFSRALALTNIFMYLFTIYSIIIWVPQLEPKLHEGFSLLCSLEFLVPKRMSSSQNEAIWIC